MAYDPTDEIEEMKINLQALMAGVEPDEVVPGYSVTGIGARLRSTYDQRPGATPPGPPPAP